MSYPYRVVVSKSVETTVSASDRASHKLKLFVMMELIMMVMDQ